ncbi:MAG: hypothetical protein II400_02370, partial [Bacteroidaceae bacterium]|nr:hypothetical protein [Bacteroidaceae bacterium]
ITVRYTIEAHTGADWKNDVATECRFNYVNTSGDPAEYREVCTDYIEKDGKIIIEKTFTIPADWQEGTEVRTTVSVGAKAGNIVTPENLIVTAPVLYISEMSTENTEKIGWNEGKKIRLGIFRKFTNEKWYTLCLPFEMTQEIAETAFGAGTQIKKFGSVTEVYNAKGIMKKATFNFYNPDFTEGTGYPYLIKVGDNKVDNPQFNGVVVSKTVKYEEITVDDSHHIYTFTGNLDRMHYQVADGTMHILKDNKILQCTDDDITMFKGLRGWFHFVEAPNTNFPKDIDPSSSAGVHDFSFAVYDEFYSNINSVTTQNVKKEGIYNMAGQKVNAVRNELQKGFYIINGEKVYVK